MSQKEKKKEGQSRIKRVDIFVDLECLGESMIDVYMGRTSRRDGRREGVGERSYGPMLKAVRVAITKIDNL